MKHILVIICFIPLTTFALEIKSQMNGGDVDITVMNVPVPEQQLDKELGSGLSTVLVATLSVWKNEKLLSRMSVDYKAFYDLWAETYRLQKGHEAQKKTEQYTKKSEVINQLKNHSFKSVFQSSKLEADDKVTVIFALVIDPITKEKRLKIRKWLAQNQVGALAGEPSTSGESKATNSGTSTVPINNGLFSQILDEELGDQTDSGKWVFVSPKKIITIKDLKHEK